LLACRQAPSWRWLRPLFFFCGSPVAIRYLRALHATMDCLSTAHKPFPGGLAWLIIVPGAGYAWICFPDRLSWGIRSECRASGVAASSATGLPQSIGMVVCIPLLLAPGVQIAAAVACLALWLVFWAQSRGFREKLLALA